MSNRSVSLLSPQPIAEKAHRPLLLQFILFELFEAYKAYDGSNWEMVVSPHPRFFPYDWGKSVGYLNKAKEHSVFLSSKRFERQLEKAMRKKLSKEQLQAELKKLYHVLEPLIEKNKEDENLIFFLLKNRQVIDELVGKGHLQIYQLETLGEKLCDRYHQRGFFSQIPEFKLLLTEVIHG